MTDSQQPSTKERRAFYRFARIVVAIVVPLVAKLRTEGIENIPREGPVILALNHLSWLDIPLVSVRVARINHYMAKIELFSVPLLGGLMRLLGSFPVRRGESDRESLRTAEAILKAGEVLVVFPEGHRSGGAGLLPGHPGIAYVALRSGAPIVPVAVYGTEHAFKGFRLGPFAPRVTVRFGKPFQLEQPARRDRDSLARASDQIMRAIAALLPPSYRGVYADLDSTAQIAGVIAPDAAPARETGADGIPAQP